MQIQFPAEIVKTFYLLFWPVSDTRSRQTPALPLPYRVPYFEHFQHSHQRGRTFHFLDISDSRTSPQYIFLIHNQEITIYRNILHIISSLILNNFTNTSPIGSQHYYFFILPNLSINSFLTLLCTHLLNMIICFFLFPLQKSFSFPHNILENFQIFQCICCFQ